MAKGRVIKWSLGTLAGLLTVCLGMATYLLSTLDFNQFKPKIEKAALDATGRKLTMAGDVKLKIGLSPALAVENVSFANAKWGSGPNMASIRRLEVQVEFIPLFNGNVRIKRLILVEPDILLETSREGLSNLAFGAGKAKPEPAKGEKSPPGAEKPGAMPTLQVDELVLEKARLVFRDGKTGAAHIVTLALLEAALDAEGRARFSAEGAYNQQPFQAGGETGPISMALNPAEAWPIKLKAQAGGAAASLDGAVKDLAKISGLNFLCSLSGENLTGLNALTGAKLPDLGKYSFSGKVTDTGPRAFHIADFKGVLGGSDFAGSVSLDFSGKRPFADLSLASKTLDIRPFLPDKTLQGDKGRQKPDPKAKPKTGRVIPDNPLPADLLFLADCKANVRVATLQLQDYALSNVLADLILKNGVLDVSSLKARGGKGSLDMKLRAAAQGKKIGLDGKASLNQLNLGGLLGFLGITEAFLGNLDMDLDFRGKGASLREIAAGLDGFVSLSVEDGKLQNKYLDLLGGDLTSGILRMINPLAEKKDYTQVNCLITRLNVANGLADAKVLVMDTESMTVVGQGTLDLKTETLDMSLDPLPKKGVLSKLNINLSFSLSELAQPFALRGTLAAPKLTVDRAKAALALGKGVGGALLFGPAGAAAALLGGGQSDENPCETAMVAAEKGVRNDGGGKEESKKGTAGKAVDSVVGGIKGVGKGLKNMFGQ